jgi:hypothetical protein
MIKRKTCFIKPTFNTRYQRTEIKIDIKLRRLLPPQFITHFEGCGLERACTNMAKSGFFRRNRKRKKYPRSTRKYLIFLCIKQKAQRRD